MLATNPFEGKKSLQTEEVKRDRYLDEEEIVRFLKHCKVQHIGDFFVIAVNTGMDRGEILNFKWEQVRLDNFIYLHKVKTRPERYIPINKDLGN